MNRKKQRRREKAALQSGEAANNYGAIALLQAQRGHIDDAIKTFRRALKAAPGNADFHYNLGYLYLGQGKSKNAINSCRRAIAINPDYFDAYNILGNAFKELGRLDDAVACFRKIITIKPDHAPAHYNLGNAFIQSGQLDDAVASYRKVLVLNPDHAEAHRSLANALKRLCQLDGAMVSMQTAITLKPDDANSHYELGNLFKEMGQLEETVASYHKALAIKPDYMEAYNNLGLTLQFLGKIDEAAECYYKALEIKPDEFILHNNLAISLEDMGKLNEAVASYHKAIAIKPDYAEAHSNLGNVLQELGSMDEAVASYHKAIAIKPDYAEAHNNLGNALQVLGSPNEAAASFSKALAIKPDHAGAHSNLLLNMHYAETDLGDLFNEHLLWQDLHGEHHQELACKHEKGDDPQKRLNVGFVSGNFCEHSISYFLEPLFAAHDRQAMSIFCYSNSHMEDQVTSRLREEVGEWRKIASLEDQAVIDMVRNDRIDILVDLSGHTAKNRLKIFVSKPAPIQVTWLGYPDTTGLSAMDYRLCDAISDPPGASDNRCSERLVRMPNGFLCYQPLDDAANVTPSPMKVSGYVTFVSFNNLAKTTPEVVRVWARVLNAVPGSRLFFKNKAFGCPKVKQRYVSMFEALSVSADRLIILPKTPTTKAHLDEYGRADIALDAFPYNGTTTTCEAMWMGVPVVTLCGEHHSSRVGASLLTQVGLDSLIAETEDDFVEIAVSLASDPDRLSNIRENIRTNMQASSLCDAEGFARDMEMAFRNMWYEWCKDGDIDMA